MDTTFTDEQEMLRELADKLAEQVGTGADPQLEPQAAWQRLVDAGLITLRLPEGQGGSGTSAVEPAIVAEMLGRRVSPVPFIGPLLAVELMALAGVPPESLDAVATGRQRTTVALDQSLGALATVGGAGDGVGWDAAGASSVVVLHPSPTGLFGLAVMETARPALPAADLTRQLTRVQAVAEPSLLGGALDPDALARWEAFALVMLCADMVGAMQGTLDMAVAYAAERVQFGRPIGSFQAIQHLAADQHVSTAASRSALYYAAWAVDDLGVADALSAARTAKAFVSRHAREVAEAAIQIYGGIGHTWEHAAHYYLRRVLLDRATLGDESAQLGHLAEAVLAAAKGSPDQRSP